MWVGVVGVDSGNTYSKEERKCRDVGQLHVGDPLPVSRAAFLEVNRRLQYSANGLSRRAKNSRSD